MLIIDAHLDLAWNALQWNRNLHKSVNTIRTQESGMTEKARAQNTVAFPEMRRGRVGLSIATLLARSTGKNVPHIDYDSPEQANAIAHGQLAYYRALERGGHARVITDAAALDQHVAQWQAADAEIKSLPLGFIISMEGADPILAPDDLEDWWNAGLRLIGPAHYGTCRYAGGTSTEGGLTDLGVPLLREMERLGVILDLTHLSDRAFWEALDQFGGTVIASHQNSRALVPHQRQFSDEQFRAIFERGGVVGAAFDAWMLQPGWTAGANNRSVSIDTVVDHIDYVCQLAGNSQHAAIGTDLDGGFGREQSPHDLDTIADLQRIPALLEARGYSADDINGIMHGNWLRLLRRAWGDNRHEPT